MGADTDPTPKHLGAEAAMCSAMMMEPAALQHAATLGPTAFYSERYRRIFLACAKTFAKRGAVDPLLVVDELTESGQLEQVGGIAQIAKMTAPDGFTFQHAKHYAEILKREEARRAGVLAARELAAIAAGADAPAIIAAFRDRARLLEADSPRPDLRRISMAEVIFGALPPIPWLVEDWFGVGDSFVLGGEWGSGKSYLALDLAVSLAAGISWLGHVPVVAATPVLYLDEENNEINARRRLSRVIKGRNIDPIVCASLPLSYLTMNKIKLNTARGKNIVRREIEAIGAKLVILDSFVRFGRKLKSTDNDALAEFHDDAITPLKVDFGVGIFGLDHMRKPGEADDKADPAHRIQGGQEKSAFPDGVATFTRDRESTKGQLRASKVRWTETLPPPIGTDFHTSEDEASVWITGHDAAIDAEVSVRDILTDAGSAGVRALQLFKRAEARGANYKTAVRTVKRMVKRGAIARIAVPGGILYRLEGV